MAIPQAFVTQLVMQLDLEDIVAGYAPIKRGGAHKKVICPFHSEKTPSLVLYPDTQSFYCFGCGAGGDIISFIMRIEHMTYPEAVQFLAKKAGMTVPQEMGQDHTAQQKLRILEINRETARFFHKTLTAPQGKAGRLYLKDRGVSDQILVTYGLGYAPHDWTSLRDHLLGQGFSLDDMELARVVVKGPKGNYYDQFRHRVMFPIIDTRNQVVAFGGRVLDDSKPKYLNSADTLVFKKSHHLFSLNLAKKSKQGRIILTEGYLDAIAVYAAGFDHVVATLGTALTAQQARLLAKYTTQVILAYDADAPGVAAALRAKTILEEVRLNIKMVTFSGAKDPDEYLKKFGVDRFQLLLDGAKDPLALRLEQEKAKFDLTYPDQKTVYLKQAISLLMDCKDPIERESYAGMLATETDISREKILLSLDGLLRKVRKQGQQKQWNEIVQRGNVSHFGAMAKHSENLGILRAEERIIGLLLHNSDYIPYFLEHSSIDAFTGDLHRRAMTAICQIFSEQGQECVRLSHLLPHFTTEEYDQIAAMLAKEQQLPTHPDTLSQAIKTLHHYEQKQKKETDLASMSPQEIKAYYERKKKGDAFS